MPYVDRAAGVITNIYAVQQTPGQEFVEDAAQELVDLIAARAQLAATQIIQAQADAAAKSAAQADTVVQYLINHTPAECAAYVGSNVTDLASAKAILQKMAMALSVLAKQGLR